MLTTDSLSNLHMQFRERFCAGGESLVTCHFRIQNPVWRRSTTDWQELGPLTQMMECILAELTSAEHEGIHV